MTTKTKFGGNKGKRSAVTVEKRRSRVAKLFAEGKSVTKIAKATGAPVRTIERDMAALRTTLQNANKESFGNFVRGQVELLTRLIQDTYDGTIPPEVSNAVRGLMDSLAKLTGSNSPEVHKVFVENTEELTSRAQQPSYVFVGGLDELDDEDGQKVLPPVLTPPPLDPTPQPVVIDDVLTAKRKAAGLLLTDGSIPPEDDDAV